MGLNIIQLAKTVAGLGFNLASDLNIAATYKQFKNTAASYNPESGIVTPQFTEATVTAMILKFSQKQTDGQTVRIGDERVLIQASELTAAGIKPASDDVLNDGAGIIRKLLNFELDASKTIYTFHARREVAA